MGEAISFNAIPSNLRVPGVYVEFNNDLNSSSAQEFKMLALGQRLPTGSVAALTPVRVSSAAQAADYFGRGSMLAGMIEVMLKNTLAVELWAIALDDDPTGVAALGSVTYTGAASHSGEMRLRIGGYLARFGVVAGQSSTAIAAAAVAAISGVADMPVTAAVDVGNTSRVNLTARNKGEMGNEIAVEVEFKAAERPTSPAWAIGAMGGGSVSPDLGAAIAVMGDNWFNWIACPYNDSDSLDVLEAELLDRWGPARQMGARAFIGYRGSLSQAATFGSSRNSHLVCCIGTGAAPQPPYLWAAAVCAAAAASLQIDPARQLQGIQLKGMLAPKAVDRWDDTERNVALWDGISTYRVDNADVVRIERLITMYQVNTQGLADDSYLDITLLETQERVRYRQRQRLSQRFPRHKLADDGNDFGAGQAVATPQFIRAELLALYAEFVNAGWCEDYEGYKASLLVERAPDDVNRVNIRDVPNYVNQLYVVAIKQQFLN